MKKLPDYIVLILIISLFVINQEALAYINPGSGSYIFQTITGGLLSIFYLFKKLILNLLNIFKKPGTKDE